MTLVAMTGLAYRLNVVSLGRFAALALLCSDSSEKCGPRWPAALSGPLCGGESGTISPEGGIGRMPIPFRQHRDVLSKSTAPAHGLAGHGEGMDARVEATQERLPDAR